YGGVDPSNSVIEFNEANNTATVTVSIPNVNLDLSLAENAYSSGEVITIDGFATNRSPDINYQGAEVTTSITNSEGTEVSREAGIVDLAPISVTSTSTNWDTTGAPLGSYTLTQTLVYNQQALASAQKSVTLNNTVPASQILSPTGGETITGTYAIAWQATDPDGDTLTIDIAYSSDGGLNWVYITTNEINDGAYLWDAASLPDGSNYRLKVIAKDGRVTATSQSDSFSLLNTGALKVNSTPTGAKVYLDGNYAYLGAYQGVTGINIPSLNVGRHLVRLTYSGYNEYYQWVDVIAGQETQVMANLTPMASVSYTDSALIVAQSVPIDVGDYSTPFVVDWNMDGKKDILIGNGAGQILYFENTGTDNLPAFGLAPTTILTGARYIAPFVVDWDNDGRKDLIVGNTTGEVVFLKNSGTDLAASFGPEVVIATVANSAIPFVVDYNEDHKKDLLVGTGDGALNLYINYGTDAQPVFNPYPDNIVLTFGGSIAPFVVTDWDDDGEKDLITGGSDGNIYLYLNNNTNEAPHFGAGQAIMGIGGPLYAGVHSTPFVIDFNNDGLRDILAGNASGELYLFMASESLISAAIDVDPDTLNIRSKGQWITVYIELPDGFTPGEIDVSSLRLQGVIPAESQPTTLGDHDADGIPDLMVKFDRQWLQSLINPGADVKITLTGRLKDANRTIKGEDTIKVIE
ncbi:MAG TPA: FG-GAP-like repeat-containing protein, partial [Candidatus Manganitrophaceae bacterium]|nr:FG-GAP-like repeat-containing protein [Candidatus Manganitrophaceae bacterium]